MVAEIGGTNIDEATRRMMPFFMEMSRQDSTILLDAMGNVISGDCSYLKLCTVCLLFMVRAPTNTYLTCVKHTSGPSLKHSSAGVVIFCGSNKNFIHSQGEIQLSLSSSTICKKIISLMAVVM